MDQPSKEREAMDVVNEDIDTSFESIDGALIYQEDDCDGKVLSSSSASLSQRKLGIAIASYSTLIKALFEDLESLNYERISLAVSHMPLLCSTIGPELTRSRLLPYISYILDSIDEQEMILGSLAHVLNLERPNSITIEHIGGLSFVEPSIVPLLGDLIFHSDSCSLITEMVPPPASLIVR